MANSLFLVVTAAVCNSPTRVTGPLSSDRWGPINVIHRNTPFRARVPDCCTRYRNNVYFIGKPCSLAHCRAPEGRFMVFEEASKTTRTVQAQISLGLLVRRDAVDGCRLCSREDVEDGLCKEGKLEETYILVECSHLLPM